VVASSRSGAFWGAAVTLGDRGGRVADEHFAYGGQAVIEGVMIRGRQGYSVACRTADGGIKVETRRWEPLTRRSRLFGLPLVRGTPALLDALIIGFRSLILSANTAAEGEGVKPPTRLQLSLSMAFALAVTIGLFVLLPTAAIHRIPQVTIGGANVSWVVNNVIEGTVRAALFVGYIYLIARAAGIRRIFQYHGAEHKVIHSYEATGAYSVKEAAPYATLHQRCGTSFIFTVLVVGIFVHALVGWPTLLVRMASRLVLLPVVAGVSYEIIRAAGARKQSRLLGLLVAPGMWLQKITTQPPTPDQMEVAIAALDGALELDRVAVPAPEQSASQPPEQTENA
jgi:uncharacterized protein YqhQ